MKNLVAHEIEAYAEAHSIPESDACRRLQEETYASVECPQMVVGHFGRGVFEDDKAYRE